MSHCFGLTIDQLRAPLATAVAIGLLYGASAATADTISLKFVAENKPPNEVVVTLKSGDQLQDIVSKLGSSSAYFCNDPFRTNVIAMPRSNASSDQVATALTLARRDLAKAAQPLALRILAVVGTESDAKLLRKASVEETSDSAAHSRKIYQRAAAIAYIESRLGVLERGELAAALDSGDSTWAALAAILLHEYGSAKGDKRLIAVLADQNRDDFVLLRATCAALDMAPADVLGAMRKSLARYHPYISASSAALVYVLAYGNEQDRSRIAQLELTPFDATELAFLVTDPVPLLRSGVTIWAEAMMAPSLRTVAPNQLLDTALDLEDAIYERAYSEADPTLTTTLRQNEALGSLYPYIAIASFIRPHERVAEAYLGSVMQELATWVPQPWRRDALVKSLVSDGKESALLDYFTTDELTKALDGIDGGKIFPQRELLLASHRISSREFFVTLDPYHDGIERRPFALRAASNGDGAISGVLEVNPEMVDGRRLRLTLRLVLAPHYDRGDFISATYKDDQFKTHRYVVDAGRELIDSVRIRRGDDLVPVERKGDFVYEAELDQGKLDQLYVDVQLQFFDQTAHLVYDLFASDLARSLRRKGT